MNFRASTLKIAISVLRLNPLNPAFHSHPVDCPVKSTGKNKKSNNPNAIVPVHKLLLTLGIDLQVLVTTFHSKLSLTIFA